MRYLISVLCIVEQIDTHIKQGKLFFVKIRWYGMLKFIGIQIGKRLPVVIVKFYECLVTKQQTDMTFFI